MDETSPDSGSTEEVGLTADEHAVVKAYAGLKKREKEREFTQWVRLLDVFAIGPLMIYAGMKTEEDLPRWVRGALVLFGITTIGYNGMNYLSEKDEERAAIGDE